jgi:hypothetical protein
MAFTHVTMQSEKYVCVRETGATNNVVIVDMANPGTPMRRPITADSTILAPSSKTIALKAAAAGEGGAQGDNLQVFNLDTKQKLKAFFNPVKVQFWTWTSDSNIALVTDASVFHWDVTVRVPCLAARTHTAVLEAQPLAHARMRTLPGPSRTRGAPCRTRRRLRRCSTARPTCKAPRSSATRCRPTANGAPSSGSPPAPRNGANLAAETPRSHLR